MTGYSTVYVVVGLTNGDEGKGSTVDFLTYTHNASAVVCFTSGPQKSHFSVGQNGWWHCYSQFGSGMHYPEVSTHISAQTLVKPENLLREAAVLESKGVPNVLNRLTIDPKAPVVTSLHALIGQMLEIARGNNRYGSVGMGVGQAVLDWKQKGVYTLTIGNLFGKQLNDKLTSLWFEKLQTARLLTVQYPQLVSSYEAYLKNHSLNGFIESYREFLSLGPACLQSDDVFFNSQFQAENTLVLESGQGTLLDPHQGFVPYVTKTSCTTVAADTLLNPYQVSTVKIGVLRVYGHRHGAGPFVTEDSQLGNSIPEIHNGTNPWQGHFRLGWLDLPAAQYAVAANPGLDYIALTCVDKLASFGEAKVCTGYEYCGKEIDKLETYFEWERFSGNRIRITGYKKISVPTEDRTRILFDCVPLDYEIISLSSPIHLASWFQKKLGVPVGIMSYGPRADQKIDLRSSS